MIDNSFRRLICQLISPSVNSAGRKWISISSNTDKNTDSTCSRSYREQTGRSGYITSPGFPDSYRYNHYCLWMIPVPVNTILKISFETFDLQPKHNGYCVDYIEIRGKYYCGSTAPSTLFYTGNVYIQFRSDNSENYKGFKLIWRILKVDSTCSKKPRVQDDTSGYITSPNYPDDYYSGHNCYWIIKSPENMLVEISFDKNFRIETKSEVVCCDELTIRSETGSDKYCGWTAPGKRLYIGNITIQFTSDTSRNYVGFKLSWRFVRGKVWQVIVFTGDTGTTQTVMLGFGETGSDVTYFHLGTEFKAGSNKTHELLLPVNITNPHPPRKLMLKTALTTNWRVIQVALVGVIDGDNVVYMYNCINSYADTKTCNYQSRIHKPVKWQIAVFSGIKRSSSRLHYTSGRVDIQIIGDRNESQFTYLGSLFGEHRERKDVIIFTRNIGKPKTVKIKCEPGYGENWWFLKRVELKSDNVTETYFGFNVLLGRNDYNEVSLVPNTTREVEWKIKIKTDKETEELYMNLFGSNGVQSGFSRLGHITTGHQIQMLTTKTRDLGQPTCNVGQPARNIGQPTRVAIWNRGSSTIYIFQFTMISSKIFPNQQFVADTTKTMIYSSAITYIRSNQVAFIELNTVQFGPSTVTQVTETTSTSRPSTVTQVTETTSTSNSKNAGSAMASFWATVGSAIGFTIVIAIIIVVTVVLYIHRRNMYNRDTTDVVSEPDVVYECSVGASARIGRRTVPPAAPSTPATPPAAGVGFIEVENAEDDDFTAESVYIEDIGEDGTIYARLDNMSRPDTARLQPSTSRGRTAPRVILGAEEDVGLYGELDFSRPAIPLTELNKH
ncbi:uncharacterized protein LOC141909575 isoform X2 [Tubulanus polymorphus]|uniref:uncharacterized protein LOC141909575 isoform X2 n=1 Tax=Tubulanus polymorphus TaxID=672921 RepID=UPI003DA664D4